MDDANGINVRNFGKSAIIYSIGNVGLRAASFLIIPLYTHSLSVEDYGLLVTLLTTMQFMNIFINQGSGIAFIRFAGEYDRTPQGGCLIGSSLLVNVLGGVAVMLATLAALPLFKPILHTGDVLQYMMLTGLASVSHTFCFQVLSFYRARGQAGKFMIFGIGSAVILILANLVFLYIFHMGVIGALLALIFTYGAITAYTLADVLPQTGFGISKGMFTKILRYGFPLIFSMSGQFIMGNSSMYFISYYAGLSQVAIFSLGYKLAVILDIVLILPFQLAFEPFVFANSGNPRIRETLSRLFSYLTLSLVFVSFLILILSRALIPIVAPPQYAGAYVILLFLLPAVGVKGVSYFGEVMLNMVQKTHITGFTVALWAVLALAINFLLVNRYGMYGAIIAANVSTFLSAISMFVIGRRFFPIALQWRRLTTVFFLLAGFTLAGFFLAKAPAGIFYTVSTLTLGAGILIVFHSRWFEDVELNALGYLFRSKLSGILLNLKRIG